MARAAGYILLVIASHVCCGCLSKDPVAREVNDKGDVNMNFPSFEPVPKSPEVADLGLAVILDAAEFKAGGTVALYGSYVIDGEFIQKCNDEPDTWIRLIVIRRDKPAVWTKPILEKPNLAPIPSREDEPPGPTVRSGGYFNLDLREHMGLPDEAGSYWLIVSMGDYVTDRISFEIRD